MIKRLWVCIAAMTLSLNGISQIWSAKYSSIAITKVSDGVYSIMSGGMHTLYRRTEKRNDAEFNSKVQSWFDEVSIYKGSKVLFGEHGKEYRNAGGERVLDKYVYMLWYDDIHMGLSVIYLRYDPKTNKVIPNPTNPNAYTTYHVF